ncbi:MAG TPA: hypothetical protein VJJ24_00070 [Candidatus Paceibacterota bacterium]
MRGLIVIFLSAFAVLCTGCTTTFLLPTYRDSRESPGNETLDKALQAFDMILEGHTTEKEVRDLKFGSPYTDEEIVGHLRMTAVLTQSQGVSNGVVLDPEIRKCITREDASATCKLLVIRDRRERRMGQGNAFLYWTKLHRVDEISSWSYTMWFVLEEDKVIHKQFEPAQNPSRIEDRKRDFGSIVDYSVGVP